MIAAGIDGCSAGWLVIGWDHSQPVFCLIKNTAELDSLFQIYDRVFIDIPIGLSSLEASRECDRLLRKKLAPGYQSSVFNPPVRQAVYAASYEKACILNEEITGKRISRQSWNISAKIRETDRLLQKNKSLQAKVFESHPEWCFKILNGGKPVPDKKKTMDGKEFRLKLLDNIWHNASDFYEKVFHFFQRKEVSGDDIIDAMILSYFAIRSFKNGIYSIPENPPVDEFGLPIGIHYTLLSDVNS